MNSSRSTSFSSDSDACPLHGPLEKKLDDGFRDMRDLFKGVNGRLDDLFRDLGAREEADKTQGREIRELKAKAEEVPDKIAAAIHAHRAACAIGEITEVGIKFPHRKPQYETPERGTRRQSFAPSGGMFKIPVPRVIIWIAFAVGIAVAAGGWAWGLLTRDAPDVANEIRSDRTPLRSLPGIPVSAPSDTP